MSIDGILRLFDDRVVSNIIDHDDETYIVEVSDGDTSNISDPFYIVDKNTGDKEIYDISEDLDSFFDEYENKSIYRV